MLLRNCDTTFQSYTQYLTKVKFYPLNQLACLADFFSIEKKYRQQLLAKRLRITKAIERFCKNAMFRF